jgi:hypothetical protein
MVLEFLGYALIAIFGVMLAFSLFVAIACGAMRLLTELQMRRFPRNPWGFNHLNPIPFGFPPLPQPQFNFQAFAPIVPVEPVEPEPPGEVKLRYSLTEN